MNKIIAIAIDKYINEPVKNLSNCLNDINSIIGILTSEYEYDSEDTEILILSEPQQTTQSFLFNRLNQEFYNALETDTILIIFAGHGEYHKHLKIGYWCCSDSNFDEPTTWFDIRNLLSFFSNSKAKHIALISDSCFSGSIFNRTRGGGENALTQKKSIQALTSGGLEKVSDGRANDNSPFNKAIQLTLKQNELQFLSFNQFSEATIRNFPASKTQTPEYGSLNIDGDEGGTYVFKKKCIICTNVLPFENTSLALKIDNRINIASDINIPFFSDNENFDSKLINAFIQKLGYQIINDIRNYVSQDIDFLIKRSSDLPFEIESGYTVHRLDQDYLSISFSQYEFFGTAHPNYYIYSVNFKLKPDAFLVGLFEVFEINYNDGLIDLIKKYAEEDCKEILLKHVEEYGSDDLNFSFDDQTLYLYFINHLPHVYKPCGIIEVPLSEIAFK